jgi:hypothetical protein
VCLKIKIFRYTKFHIPEIKAFSYIYKELLAILSKEYKYGRKIDTINLKFLVCSLNFFKKFKFIFKRLNSYCGSNRSNKKGNSG